MALDLAQAKQQLATLVKGSYTADDLLNLAQQLDVHAEGNITVFYGGKIDDIKTSDIAKTLVNDVNVRILDKTNAAKFLASEEFLTALGKTKGIEAADMLAEGFTSLAKTELLNWLYDGKSGPWANISGRFAEETIESKGSETFSFLRH